MRRRLQRKLDRAIRVAEHRSPGLQKAVDRRSRCDGGPSALSELLLDPDTDWSHKFTLSNILLSTRGSEPVYEAIRQRVGGAPEDLKRSATYLRLCLTDTPPTRFDLEVFERVMSKGELEDQWDAIDGLGGLPCATVRHLLMKIVRDRSGHPSVAERALEMLHLQPSGETIDFCLQTINDTDPAFRFWSIYVLWQVVNQVPRYRPLVLDAIQRCVSDSAVAPGWWTVGQEARAVLVDLRRIPSELDALQQEIERIRENASASEEEKRWAECFSN